MLCSTQSLCQIRAALPFADNAHENTMVFLQACPERCVGTVQELLEMVEEKQHVYFFLLLGLAP